ncbi:MAG: DUF6901 family protein [Candidatus Latescibacterota bacterium]|jgi:hypothetical protein|tara:strand:+ start:254 stop:970 length:717 start_codon:yes stop_codon:yes gene_type:complete
MAENTVHYVYAFRLGDGSQRVLDIVLDAQTMAIAQPARKTYPSWTALECDQCPNCPLSTSEHPRCPIAVALVDLVDFFKDAPSYGAVDVQLETAERSYSKNTTAQRALASILGIYMVASGCPIMDKLRPMVRFHLPFSNASETTYRVISIYLMAQYFRKRKGIETDWDLRGLIALYQDIHQINTHFLERLKQIETQDTSANALIILDCYANQVQLSIDDSSLGEFESLFAPYLTDGEI